MTPEISNSEMIGHEENTLNSKFAVISDNFLNSCFCGRSIGGDTDVESKSEDNENFPQVAKFKNDLIIHEDSVHPSEDLVHCCAFTCCGIDHIDDYEDEDETCEKEEFSLIIRERLPFDEHFHKKDAKLQLSTIWDEATALFNHFNINIGNLSGEISLILDDTNQTSMESMKRILNMECFIKLKSDLNCISTEVKHAQNLIYRKIDLMGNTYSSLEPVLPADASISVDFDVRDTYYEESIASFIIDFTLQNKEITFLPWRVRRFVFLLSSSWNRRLATIEELIFAMKRQNYVSPSIISVFNWGNNQKKSKNVVKVNLGAFNEGHPRLETGVGGIVIPVKEDQICSIIAYSLSSHGYQSIFKRYSSFRVKNKASFFMNSTQTIPSVKKSIWSRMQDQGKSHIKHKFYDINTRDRKQICKFVCTSYFATQFNAVREAYLSSYNSLNNEKENLDNADSTELDFENGYVYSLYSSGSFSPRGGKSGAK